MQKVVIILTEQKICFQVCTLHNLHWNAAILKALKIVFVIKKTIHLHIIKTITGFLFKPLPLDRWSLNSFFSNILLQKIIYNKESGKANELYVSLKFYSQSQGLTVTLLPTSIVSMTWWLSLLSQFGMCNYLCSPFFNISTSNLLMCTHVKYRRNSAGKVTVC